MPKRSADKKIEEYYTEIKRLMKRKKKSRRRMIVYSSSSDSENKLENGTKRVESHKDATTSKAASLQPTTLPPPPAAVPLPTTPPAPRSPSPVRSPLVPINELVVPTQGENKELSPELDPDLLDALGEASDDTPVYGPDIHNKLAQRWLPILKKGLQTEIKDKLLKEYMFPANCNLLKAPILNPEISAAVAEFVKGRDKKMQTKQDQLGLGITAINKAMSLLLTGDDKVQALKYLSDGCRILTDLHFIETQVRTKLLSPGLDKSVLAVIQGQNRDETLFGNTLAEKIKASKAIEKQGLQIKKPLTPKPSTSSAPATPVSRSRYQGNFPGPPRYQQSGRGGRITTHRNQYRRIAAAVPHPPPSNRQSTSTTTSNRRAPTQH